MPIVGDASVAVPHIRRYDQAMAVPSSGLARLLQEHTRALHERAEQSGIVQAILRGTASRFGYALMLRNLLPVYRAMEEAFHRHRSTPGVRAIVVPGLYRHAAIESDLVDLYGARWWDDLPLLAAGNRYARRVRLVSGGDGARLIGHAHVRYLGDLSGGPVIDRMLARTLRLSVSSRSFLAFPEITDTEQAKRAYRRSLDCAGSEVDEPARIVEESEVAFRLNIALSEEVNDTARVSRSNSRM